MATTVRLQVALAQLGYCSRRGAREIIASGRVKVNGRAVFEPGLRVRPDQDVITLDDKRGSAQEKVYLVLNKPQDIISTVTDTHSRPTVIDLIGRKGARVYPVGRLDKDTTGLMILTNDGGLAHRLAHPKFGIKKIYKVDVEGNISRKTIEKLSKGILLEGKKTYPCVIRALLRSAAATTLEVVLTEGRKRQIKKMFSAVGHPVRSIQRTAFGTLKLGRLKPGQWRRLSRPELEALKKTAGVA